MDQSQPHDTRAMHVADATGAAHATPLDATDNDAYGDAYGDEMPHTRRFDPTRELPIPQPRDAMPFEDKVEHHVRKVEAHVRARPFVTVALALTAGFLLGRVLRD
jgi:hypothetical protein